MRWRNVLSIVVAFAAGFLILAAPRPGLSQVPSPGRLVLTYGEGKALLSPAVTVAGGRLIDELGERKFTDVAVVVLANVPYGAIPQEVSSQLRDFLQRGGTLLVTGGKDSFGSGGYEPLADILPFVVRAPSDFVAKPFKSPVVMAAGHPAITGGQYATIGNPNDMNPKPGATEILQYPGGFVPNPSGGAGTFSSPLIAEQRVGAGLVLGIAFDVSEVVPISPGGSALLQNIMQYLISQSIIPAPRQLTPSELRTGKWALAHPVGWRAGGLRRRGGDGEGRQGARRDRHATTETARDLPGPARNCQATMEGPALRRSAPTARGAGEARAGRRGPGWPWGGPGRPGLGRIPRRRSASA